MEAKVCWILPVLVLFLFHQLRVESIAVPIKESPQKNPNEINAGRQFGGGGGGFGQGGGGGFGPGGGGGGGTTEDDTEEEATSPGPGALGILSGLFGIFNGIGGLNYNKVLESTVNFYPPHLKEKAQAEIDRLLGRTTKKPPRNTTVIVYVEKDGKNGTTKIVKGVTTVLSASSTAATTKVTSTTEEDEEEEDYASRF